MDLLRPLTIETLESGALIERLNVALDEILADCADINKVPDSIREITCKIKVKPDQNRVALAIGLDVNTKLGTRFPIIAQAFHDDQGKAHEPTAKQGTLFDDDDIPGNEPGKITTIGGSRD